MTETLHSILSLYGRLLSYVGVRRWSWVQQLCKVEGHDEGMYEFLYEGVDVGGRRFRFVDGVVGVEFERSRRNGHFRQRRHLARLDSELQTKMK